MARSSRHKLHRSHKHRDRSLSDDEDISKERKQKAEDEDTVKASRVSDQEKRRNSSKDVVLASNGDVTSEHGKKRKDIGDRWNGGGDKDVRTEKEMKKDELVVKNEKISRGKYTSSVSKNPDDMSEKGEEKRRMDKESSSSLYKDGKEVEKVKEKEKTNGKEMEKKERGTAREVEVHEAMHSREAEKEKEKRHKRRVESGDYDKVDDGREDHSKYRSHKDGKCKEKYRDELDREYRHYDDKRRRVERSSRTHTSEKSDRHYRDETKITESHDKKSKFLDSEHDNNRYTDNHISKHKDSRGRKKSSDETCDQTETKTRSAKEPRDPVKYGSNSSRYDSRPDRAKLEQSDIEKAESSLNSTRPKNSPNSAYGAKDQKWEKSGKTESNQRESSSADMHQSSSAVRERISEVSSDKIKPKASSRSDTSVAEADRTTRSDSRTPQNHFPEKSPFMNERQPEDAGQKSNSTPMPNTPNHLPPPSDRRTNSSRYKRGPVTTPWKGPGTAWPPPVPNGFMPMQHGPPLGFPHPSVPQFPPQPLFRPSMDMINPPYSIHPYDMQMWDGTPAAMFGEDPHMFGRQEWDPSRAMMRSRGWEMNKDAMWNGQNGNVGMEYSVSQKEIEYSHDGHVKSEKVLSDDGGSKVSRDESSAQKEVRQLSKPVAEKTTELPKMVSPQKNSEPKSDDRVNYVTYYLSKIDILPELAHPDVYNQCKTFVEGKDVNDASHAVSMGQRKNNLKGFTPVAKSRQSLLSKPSDAIFQKAMALYKSKVGGYLNEGKKGTSGDAEANAIEDGDKDMGAEATTEEKEKINGADENCDVEMSEKTENIVNPESFGVDISRILSPESTH